MSILIIIIGGLLIYFGINKKVGTNKQVGEMTGGDLIKTGFSGYLKMMMIVGGVCLSLMGFIFLVLF